MDQTMRSSPTPAPQNSPEHLDIGLLVGPWSLSSHAANQGVNQGVVGKDLLQNLSQVPLTDREPGFSSGEDSGKIHQLRKLAHFSETSAVGLGIFLRKEEGRDRIPLIEQAGHQMGPHKPTGSQNQGLHEEARSSASKAKRDSI
jgi:hypothetical protein